MPMVVTSSATATIEARPCGMVCNQGRARHNTAEHVSPIHHRNKEPLARSVKKLLCKAWRAKAITSATNSAISTTANTAGEVQKSGRKNVGARAEALGDNCERAAETDAAMASMGVKVCFFARPARR